MRTYRTPVDAEGDATTIDKAVAIRNTVYEIIHPDGTESLLDEWDVPINHPPEEKTA